MSDMPDHRTSRCTLYPFPGPKLTGMWASSGNRTPFHGEGVGKGNVPKLVKCSCVPTRSRIDRKRGA